MSQLHANRLGLWSSTFVAILGTIYLLLLIGYFTIEGFAFPPTPFVQTMGGLDTILVAPAILVLFVSIGSLAAPEKEVYARIAVSFTVLFVAMVSINRFVQLTVVRLSPPGASSADLARFLPYSTGSAMFALEILGWGFFLSLGMLFLVPLFTGGRLQTMIRWLLILFAAFSLLSVAGFASNTPLTAAGFIAWGPILTGLAILFVVFFRKRETLE